ncbi:hypothetical protein KSP40_PGU014293 [Platanthera guangdongensis]|uniref:Uncharacterized protein n=1 Tax=Platanthera guangdongensis TaxID=2320717 RepID=A0ABR2MVI5_9ASPA
MAVEESASAAPDKCLQPPNCGGDQIPPPNQMTPSGAPVFLPKTPAMSQQQSNLMSPTSNLVIQPAIQRSEPMPLLEQMQLQFIKATDLPQISAPQLGHSQIQMKPSGAPVLPAKTPAMSQQQSNLMSPTSNFVMQPRILRSGPLSPLEKIELQFDMARKQSTSAAPAKSLKPPNCSGDQIAPPNPQIPNLSSPIVSPSSTSMDLPQISAPQLDHSQIQMKLSGAPLFPQKKPAMSQQQNNLMSPISNFVMQPALLRSGPLSLLEKMDLQFIKSMEQSASAAPAKSLKPPNCSGDQMTPSRIRDFPPKTSFGDQQQFGMAMDAQGAIRKPQQLSFLDKQQQQLGSGTGMMSQAGQLSMLSSSQPAAHANTQVPYKYNNINKLF